METIDPSGKPVPIHANFSILPNLATIAGCISAVTIMLLVEVFDEIYFPHGFELTGIVKTIKESRRVYCCKNQYPLLNVSNYTRSMESIRGTNLPS